MSGEEIGESIDRLPILFEGYKLDPGGIKYILDESVPSLEQKQFQRGLELAEKARTAQEQALDLQLAWDQRDTGDPLAREGTNRLDDRIDKTLSNLLNGLKTFAAFPEGREKRRIAQKLIGEYFPRGVFPITSKKFINQHAHVEKLVDKLQSNHRAELETLALAELVDDLGELNEEFGSQLNPGNDGVTYDELREARSQAEEAFYEFFAAVVGEYGGDLETLNEVIQPYLEVNTRLRRHMKRGGTKPQVDPETGEPVEPNERNSPTDGDPPRDGEPTRDGESSSEERQQS